MNDHTGSIIVYEETLDNRLQIGRHGTETLDRAVNDDRKEERDEDVLKSPSRYGTSSWQKSSKGSFIHITMNGEMSR